jgi:trigger factor
MEVMRREEADERLKNEIYESLLKSSAFEIPESLVARQKDRLLEQAGIAPSSNGQDKPAAAAVDAEAMEKARKQVRLYFILEKIADTERIDPSEAEVEERLRLLAERAKQSLEEVREMYEEDVYQNLRHAKTTDFLVKHANVKEETQ